MTPSNHIRPACGRSNTQVSETSNCRNAISYPYPACRSVSVKIEGKRRDQRAKKLRTADGPSRSQTSCNSAALLQLAASSGGGCRDAQLNSMPPEPPKLTNAKGKVLNSSRTSYATPVCKQAFPETG